MENLLLQFNQLSTQEKPENLEEIVKQILEEARSNSDSLSFFVDNGILVGIENIIKNHSQELILMILDLLGELGKDEENRSKISASPVFDLLFSLLEKDDQEVWRLSLRVFGNLCFDHDENRKKILEKNQLEKFLDIFKKAPETNIGLLRNCVGFILNFSNENEQIQAEIGKKGGIGLITALLKLKEEKELLFFVLRTLSVLVDNEDNIPFIAEGNTATDLLNLITTKKKDIQQMALEIFTHICVNDQTRRVVVEQNLIVPLLEFSQQKLSEEIQIMAYRSLSYLSLEDKGIEIMLANSALDIVKGLIFSENETLLLYGAMWMGNLARSEETIFKLMEKDILKKLMELIKHENIRIQHLAGGVIRNLAYCEKNRISFKNYPEIFPLLANLLESERPEIQNYGVTTLNFLTTIQENCALIIQKDCIDSLMKLAKTEKVPRNYYLAARAISNLVLSTESEEILCNFIEKDISYVISLLTKSKFGEVQLDGIKIFEHLGKQKKTREFLFEKPFDTKGFITLLNYNDLEMISKLCSVMKTFLDLENAKKFLVQTIDKLRELTEKNSENVEFVGLLNELIDILKDYEQYKIVEEKKEEKDDEQENDHDIKIPNENLNENQNENENENLKEKENENLKENENENENSNQNENENSNQNENLKEN
ncbi:rap1 gtpase-gdp dissociation stimulator 1 [Anaeramoeba ignava]|uniref:Rap1 gtpase-gdp dissociation stimulator 1 n=1 Tax=Anaeramoeba ignava TaxID=1746090 RepID=A0A9Q0LF27_ANAIG|nr:rap1 gtpase-gdp dissociation stimulator 1 [Anaeramoeba ignava]